MNNEFQQNLGHHKPLGINSLSNYLNHSKLTSLKSISGINFPKTNLNKKPLLPLSNNINLFYSERVVRELPIDQLRASGNQKTQSPTFLKGLKDLSSLAFGKEKATEERKLAKLQSQGESRSSGSKYQDISLEIVSEVSKDSQIIQSRDRETEESLAYACINSRSEDKSQKSVLDQSTEISDRLDVFDSQNIILNSPSPVFHPKKSQKRKEILQTPQKPKVTSSILTLDSSMGANETDNLQKQSSPVDRDQLHLTSDDKAPNYVSSPSQANLQNRIEEYFKFAAANTALQNDDTKTFKKGAPSTLLSDEVVGNSKSQKPNSKKPSLSFESKTRNSDSTEGNPATKIYKYPEEGNFNSSENTTNLKPPKNLKDKNSRQTQVHSEFSETICPHLENATGNQESIFAEQSLNEAQVKTTSSPAEISDPRLQQENILGRERIVDTDFSHPHPKGGKERTPRETIMEYLQLKNTETRPSLICPHGTERSLTGEFQTQGMPPLGTNIDGKVAVNENYIASEYSPELSFKHHLQKVQEPQLFANSIGEFIAHDFLKSNFIKEADTPIQQKNELALEPLEEHYFSTGTLQHNNSLLTESMGIASPVTIVQNKSILQGLPRNLDSISDLRPVASAQTLPSLQRSILLTNSQPDKRVLYLSNESDREGDVVNASLENISYQANRTVNQSEVNSTLSTPQKQSSTLDHNSLSTLSEHFNIAQNCSGEFFPQAWSNIPDLLSQTRDSSLLNVNSTQHSALQEHNKALEFSTSSSQQDLAGRSSSTPIISTSDPTDNSPLFTQFHLIQKSNSENKTDGAPSESIEDWSNLENIGVPPEYSPTNNPDLRAKKLKTEMNSRKTAKAKPLMPIIMPEVSAQKPASRNLILQCQPSESKASKVVSHLLPANDADFISISTESETKEFTLEQSVDLLAQAMYGLLRQRLLIEQERRGKY